MSGNDPRVSAVMSVYGELRFLEEAVGSLADQDFPELEVIVVDDGTGEPERVARLATADGRVRVLANERTLGHSASLNRAIALARGDIIVRLDADDVAEPGRVGRLVAALDRDPELGLLGSWATIIDADGLARKAYRTPDTDLRIRWSLLFRNPFCHSSVAFRKVVFDAAGGYDPALRFAEDHDLWWRMVDLCRVGNLSEPLVRYRVHPRSKTARPAPSWRDRTASHRQRGWARLGIDYDAELVPELARFAAGNRLKVPALQPRVHLTAQRLLQAFLAAPRPFTRADDEAEGECLWSETISRIESERSAGSVGLTDAETDRRQIEAPLPRVGIDQRGGVDAGTVDQDRAAADGDLPKRSAEAVPKAVLAELRRLRQSGDARAALAELARLPPESKSDPKAAFEEGLILGLIGDAPAARRAFERVVALEPGQVKAWIQLGLLHVRDRSLRATFPNFVERMLAALTRTPDHLIAAARLTVKAGFPPLAAALTNEALAATPAPGPAAALDAARVLHRLGQHGRVVTALQPHRAGLDPSTTEQARELTALALGQLADAHGGASAGYSEADRAEEIAVAAILSRSPAFPDRAVRGSMAIVLSGLGPGGAQTQLVQLVRELHRSSGSRPGAITLLLRSGSNDGSTSHRRSLLDCGVSIVSIDTAPPGSGEIVPEPIAAMLTVLSTRVRLLTSFLVEQLHRCRPEVVLAMSHGLEATLAACVAGVPRIVVSPRGDRPPSGGKREHMLRRPYQLALAAGRAAFCTNSAATAREYGDWLGVPAGSVATIYNGVSVDTLAAARNPEATARYRTMLNIPPGTSVVGSIFTARRVKRLDLWIRAAHVIAARRPDVVFVLVGTATTDEHVAGIEIGPELEGRLHMVGIRKDVAAWIDLMDVVLLTSASEGTPNTLLEAQALGRPVVATDVGGSGEAFVPDVTGLLVSPNPTPDEVADAVLRILANPDFSLRTREEGPALIRRRFGVARMAREFMELCFPGS